MRWVQVPILAEMEYTGTFCRRRTSVGTHLALICVVCTGFPVDKAFLEELQRPISRVLSQLEMQVSNIALTSFSVLNYCFAGKAGCAWADYPRVQHPVLSAGETPA